MANQPTYGAYPRDEQLRGLSGMLAFLTTGMVVAAIYFASEVLVPFALAVLLGFLLMPAVRLLRRLRLGRVTAVGVTVIVAFLAIFAFGAIVAQELSQLDPELPIYEHNIEAKLDSLPKALPIARVSAAMRQLTAAVKRSEAGGAPTASGAGGGGAGAQAAKPLPVEIEQPVPTPLQIAQAVIGPLLQPLATAGLVVVLVVFILLEREELRDRLLRLFGGGDLHRSTEALNEAAQRVSRYLLSQLAVNAVEGVLLGIGLAVIGIPFAALWAILAILLRFIPYLGIVIAALFPLALALAVAPGWSLVLWTILLFIGVETVVANLVEPRLYAGTTGLSSVAVIVAAVFWTWLWGPVGLLLSTPLTACLLVLGRYIPQLRVLDVLLGSEPVLTAEETFYQRLLAGDPEEATDQAEEFARERSIDEFAEEVALPVLARAQADSDSGILSAERREVVREGFAQIIENLGDDWSIETGAATAGEGPETGSIVCVAGRNELDEAAALLLASLLRARGRSVAVIAANGTVMSGGEPRALAEARLVYLSLVSTASPARARHIVRRLRRRAPGARIVTAFWGAGADSFPPEALALTAADAIVTTLAGAIAEIEQQPGGPATPALAAGGEAIRAHAG